MSERYLTARAAAAYLGLTEKAVRRAMERKLLDSAVRRLGRRVLLDREALDHILKPDRTTRMTDEKDQAWELHPGTQRLRQQLEAAQHRAANLFDQKRDAETDLEVAEAKLKDLAAKLDEERGYHYDELEDAKSEIVEEMMKRRQAVDARNRAIEKHDAMVSALREQQLELAVYKGLVKEFLAAHKAMENATYWLNKVRTDEDYDDANRMVSDAHDQQEAVVEKAKMYVGDNHD